MRVLIFSPHPDDDIIGCGGTIAKLRNGASKSKVTIVYMTSGDAGRLDYAKKDLARIREGEARGAAEALDVSDLVFLRIPDGYIESSKQTLVSAVNLIRGRKPHIVYVPHAEDAHRDHKNTNMLAIEAIRRASGPWHQECVPRPWETGTVLGYEVWTPLSNPTYTEDITDFMQMKRGALEMHRTQLKDINYMGAVEGLNMYRGAMTGKGKYCECFDVIKAPQNLIGILSGKKHSF